MNHQVLLLVLLLSSLFLLNGCIEQQVVTPPYSTSQFINKTTDANYQVYKVGGYDGLCIRVDVNKLMFEPCFNIIFDSNVSGVPGRVAFVDNDGNALTTDSGLDYNSQTNTLMVNGVPTLAYGQTFNVNGLAVLNDQMVVNNSPSGDTFNFAFNDPGSTGFGYWNLGTYRQSDGYRAPVAFNPDGGNNYFGKNSDDGSGAINQFSNGMSGDYFLQNGNQVCDKADSTGCGYLTNETDPLSLHLNQSTPQTVINGTPSFSQGIDTNTINYNNAQNLTLFQGLTIADASDGKELRVYRNAAEDFSNIRMFIDNTKIARIDTNADALRFGVDGATYLTFNNYPWMTFTTTAEFLDRFIFGRQSGDYSTNAFSFKRMNKTQDYMLGATGATGLNAAEVFVFGRYEAGGANGYYPQTHGGNPTVLVESGIDPDTGTINQWQGWWNDGTNNFYDTGSGRITMTSGLEIIDRNKLGTEKVTNGSFTGSANGWGMGTGWTYTSNMAYKNADGNGILTQNVGLTAGKWYELSLAVVTWSAGTLIVSAGDVNQVALSTGGTQTTYPVYRFKALSDANLTIYPSNFSRFYIDNVSVKQIGDGNLTVTGAVGIGTEPTTYNLDVNGTMRVVNDSNLNTNVYVGGNQLFYGNGKGLPYADVNSYHQYQVITIGASNTWYPVDKNIFSDNNNLFHMVDNNSLVAEVKGTYVVNWGMAVKDLANNELMGTVGVNGVPNLAASGHGTVSAVGTYSTISGNAIIKMNVGDKLNWFVENENSASNITIAHVTTSIFMVGG